MGVFFSRLNYSYGNEDWSTEARALRLQSQDQVLCITASGDRPLNLLVRDCQRIVCIDANPIQNYLLQLKMAAMQVLGYNDYLAFLGALPRRDRCQMLQQLFPHMDQQAAQFWQEHQGMIKRGVLYQGAIERLTKIVARCATLVRGRKVKRLFSIDNLEEQRKFVQEEWDTYLWRKLFEIILNPLCSRFVLEDPGLANVGRLINAGRYIYDRLHASLEWELARKNPILSLTFQGKVFPEAFSPYLTEEGTEVIKTRLRRLEICTMDVISYLESLSGPTFDVFSLSDVASYLSYPHFIALLQGMIKTAKPGARFCLRQFLSSHEIPEELQSFFIRDRALERDLGLQDHIYRFVVGTVGQVPSAKPVFFQRDGHHLRGRKGKRLVGV